MALRQKVSSTVTSVRYLDATGNVPIQHRRRLDEAVPIRLHRGPQIGPLGGIRATLESIRRTYQPQAVGRNRERQNSLTESEWAIDGPLARAELRKDRQWGGQWLSQDGSGDEMLDRAAKQFPGWRPRIDAVEQSKTIRRIILLISRRGGPNTEHDREETHKPRRNLE